MVNFQPLLVDIAGIGGPEVDILARRTTITIGSLAISGACALGAGFLVDAPGALTALCLVWGAAVVADSAQFSTVVTECIEPRLQGTALTLQLSSGFLLTVFTIFLVPAIRDATSWGVAFLVLAPGPFLGAYAMQLLEREKAG